MKNISDEMDDTKIINAKLLIENYRKNLYFKNEKISINDTEFKVFSQFGDDGIIQFIIEKLNLPKKYQNFLEFGVQDYIESNTRFLLINNNWSGTICDSSKENIDKIKKSKYFWQHNLNAKSIFITRENINNLIEDYAPKDLGLISIDIDGNDYWIFKEIKIRPIFFIIEYNSLFGEENYITIPYSDKFDRTKAHYSNLYWGASLNCIIQEAERKKYKFIGTNSAGNNSYFIREEYFEKLNLNENSIKFNISKFRESRNKKKEKTFLSKKDQLECIKDMIVYDLKKKSNISIKELFNL